MSATYDTAGRRTAMTVSGQAPVSYTCDASARLTGVAQGPQATRFTYDALYRRTVELPNSIVVEYQGDMEAAASM